MSEMIELFVQFEGVTDVKLIHVPHDGTVRDFLAAAQTSGVNLPQGDRDVIIFVEDSDEEIALDLRLKDAGIRHRQRIHCHRCRQVAITVNFNGRKVSRAFPPSTTVKRVKKWTDGKEQFDLKGVDATDHVLQICGASVRPDEDTHIGTLVQHPKCDLCFDLVPKVRVEG
jgi:hypothetical protein